MTTNATLTAIGRQLAVIKIWRRLKSGIFNSYRPELHYMRGPGPKWREKRAHGARSGSPA